MKKLLYIGMPVLAVIAAGLLIYFDSQQQNQGTQSDLLTHHSHTHSLPEQPSEADLARILEIEKLLEEIDDARLAIAYLGEIAQINVRYQRFDGAGDAISRLAMVTNNPDDWINAGDFFYAWLEKEEKLERQFHFASRAISAYLQALELRPSDPNVYATIGAVYGHMADYTNAEEFLSRALSLDSNHLYANFNMGVILQESGNKIKSISYLNRSLELAKDTEYHETIRQYLRRTEIQM